MFENQIILDLIQSANLKSIVYKVKIKMLETQLHIDK